MTNDLIPGFHAVIPAGGAGTRLWPLSRRAEPKFLQDLTGSGRTLLQATWDRLVPLAGPAGVMIVTGGRHADAVAAQVPVTAANLVVEPSPKDSMAAIGLAAAIVERRAGAEAIVGSFAADHVIGQTDRFHRAVRDAVSAAHAGFVSVIGIAPTEPSTAFGYIAAGDPFDPASGVRARHVQAFVEKPDAETAAAYVASSSPSYLWNAGMFVSRASVLLDHLAATLPELAASLRAIAAAWDGPDGPEALASMWPGLTRIAIDYAIAEPAAAKGAVAVADGDFDWDDVGDWDSLAGLLPDGPNGIRLLGEPTVTAIDSAGAMVVPAAGRRVCLVDMPDAVVVDTPDALLVTRRDRAQRVKEIVDRLAEKPETNHLL